jgi:phosphopantetheine adenylyltransferase
MKKGSTSVLLIAFTVIGILAVVLLSSSKRVEPFVKSFPLTADEVKQKKNSAAVAKINDRLSAMENKIVESDKKQRDSVSSINSVLS